MFEFITNWWPVVIDGFLHKSPGFILLALLLPLAFAWNDRFYGADKRKGVAKLLILLTMIVAWLAAGPFAVLAVAAWWGYRSTSFKGGAAAPRTDTERKYARKRHLEVVPVMTVIAFFHGGGFILPGVAGAVVVMVLFYLYAEYATKLAVQYGNMVVEAQREGRPLAYDFNKHLERKRGIAAGLAFLGWFLTTWMLTVAGPF